MSPYHATIQTYATSANLGPLFDRAGAKLDGLFMTTSAELTTKHGLTVIKSEGKYPVPEDKTNLANKVASAIFNEYNIKDGLALSILNDMKPGGLGTSGAGAVAVVELIDRLYELHFTTEQKIKYALLGEPQQHSDNVVPCVVGGVVLATKLKGEESPRYSKLTPSPNLAYGVVIPLDIMKIGGTTKAREAVEALSHSNAEATYLSELGELMIKGFIEGNFEKIRESVKGYSNWEKSVTFVRNLPTEENPHGIYGIDVLQLDRGLEALIGKEAILTPSGAGPAMLILAKGKDAAERAQLEVVKMYESQGHKAKGFLVSVRNTESKDDFVD